MICPDQLFRLTLAQYHQLLDHRILTPADQFEFLEGIVFEKQRPSDVWVMGKIREAVCGCLPSGWGAHAAHPLPLGGPLPESQPEPDLVISRHSYVAAATGPAGLVVEMSGVYPPTERVDLARIYARAGVPVYWVVAAAEKVIEVYTLPTGPIESPHYAKRDRYPVGTSVPVVLDGATVGTIAVADVMS